MPADGQERFRDNKETQKVEVARREVSSRQALRSWLQVGS